VQQGAKWSCDFYKLSKTVFTGSFFGHNVCAQDKPGMMENLKCGVKLMFFCHLSHQRQVIMPIACVV
jgi:hypothetical protein